MKRLQSFQDFQNTFYLFKTGLCLKVLLASMTLEAFPVTHTPRCPLIENTAEIQNQFQWIQSSATEFSPAKEKEIQVLLAANSESLSNKTCWLQQGNDTNRLSEVLSYLKLQILRLRMDLSRKSTQSVSEDLFALRQLSYHYLSTPTLVARRLGASVRSLLLDELERIMNVIPELVKIEIQKGYWRSDFSDPIEKEILGHWQSLKMQIPQNPTPVSLARHFGSRPWKSATNYRSRLSRFVSRGNEEASETLETQLHLFFKENKNNIDLQDSNRVIEHYLRQSLLQIRKNNYFVLKDWLEPVIQEKLAALKSDLGLSWPLISPLVGVALEGPFREIEGSIELIDERSLAKAKVHYQRTRNPLGRLYEIMLLKRLTQMWTTTDISQLRSDLNRVSFLNTMMAVKEYHHKFAHWPRSLNDVVKKKMLPQLPRDYFTGKVFEYDSTGIKIWSYGENGVNEKGQGDDLGLTLKL